MCSSAMTKAMNHCQDRPERGNEAGISSGCQQWFTPLQLCGGTRRPILWSWSFATVCASMSHRVIPVTNDEAASRGMMRHFNGNKSGSFRTGRLASAIEPNDCGWAAIWTKGACEWKCRLELGWNHGQARSSLCGQSAFFCVLPETEAAKKSVC